MNDCLKLDILDIIYFNRKNRRIETENKSCYVLSCRIAGESLFFYDDTTFQVTRGDVLYIPYGSSYTQECKSEELICFHLMLYGKPSNRLMVSRPEDKETICGLFCHASKLWQDKPHNYMYYCLSDLYQILALTELPIALTENSLHSVISPSLEYLDRHLYDSELSLNAVFECSHVSRAYFNKRFRELYDCAPITYINTMRINKAKLLLKSGAYTREETAVLCGFHDTKYFYTVFKKHSGMTIGEYLKEA
ncbi:MAG: helix-turn-helix transcriptional regulator [Lachnospiraceae bacterium]|nr:helix-turn-helix transcriptional regulator [Lachnospiraceae bacterium]